MELLFGCSINSGSIGKPCPYTNLISQQLYYLWRYKATDELLFLGDSQAAKHSYEMAAKWASVSTDPDSQRLERSARRTAEFLAKNPASKSAQVNAWMMVLGNAVDAATRRLAIQRIQGLGGQVSVSS